MKILYKIFLIIHLFIFTLCRTTETTLIKKIEIESNQNIVLANQFLKEANFNYQKQNYRNAIELAQKALNYHVTFEGYYLIGMSYFQLNDIQNGLEHLLIAEKIQPTHEQLLLTLGLIFSSRSEYEEALSRFEKLHLQNPKDPTYLYRLGLTYKEMKEYPKAIEYLEKAHQENFKYKDNVILLLGDIYFELNDYEKSEYYYNQLELLKPDSEYVKSNKKQLQISKLLEQGNLSFKNKRYLEAEKYYLEITKLEPKKAIGYVQLGILYTEMKNYNKAIENFKKALEINKSVEHYAYLCKSYIDNYDINSAKTCLQESKKLYPRNELILNLEAIYFKSTGNPRKAISVLNEVLTINSKNINAYKNLYLIYMELEDVKNAEQSLNQLLQIDKENRSFWEIEKKKLESLKFVFSGDEFLKKNNFNKANQEYQKALSLYKLPRVYISLGDLNYKMRNYKLAEENYKTAIKLSNESWFSYQKLLNFYKNTNQTKYDALKNEIYNKSKIHPQLLILYTEILILENNLKEALNLNQTIEKSGKNQEIAKRNLGKIYYHFALQENKKKNYKLALEHINKALIYEPLNELYLQSKSIIEENIKYSSYISTLEKAEEFFSKEDYNNAKKLYEEVLKHWNKPLILVRLAEIEFYSGNDIKGLKLLENALKNKPHEIPVLEALYNRMLEIGKIQEAEEGFMKIITIKEDAYYSYYKLGIISLLKKNYKNSLNYFDDAILFNKDFLPAKIGKGIAYYYLNELDRAQSLFVEVSKEKGFTSEIAMLNLAIIYLNKNEMNQAKMELRRIIKLFPTFSDAYYHLAYIEYENKNYPEAEKLLVDAIALQKKDLYYWGLIKVYQEYRKEKLIEVAEHFIRTYPSSPFYEKVKELYVNSRGSKQFFEISYSKSIQDYNIIPYGDKFILYNEKEIISIQKNSEKILYHLKIPQIKNIFLDHYLWIQTNDTLKILDLETGIEIANKKWNEICSVYQVQPQVILTYSNSNCSKEKYLSINQSSFLINFDLIEVNSSYIYFKKENKVYLINLNILGNINIEKIDDEFLSKYQRLLIDLQNNNIKNILRNNYFYVFLTENKSYVVYNDVIIEENLVQDIDYRIKLKDEYIMYLKGNNDYTFLRVYKFNFQNQKIEEIVNEDIDLFKNDLRYINLYGNQIFYINQNKELCYFDINKKPLSINKFEGINQFRNGIITFHY